MDRSEQKIASQLSSVISIKTISLFSIEQIRHINWMCNTLRIVQKLNLEGEKKLTFTH